MNLDFVLIGVIDKLSGQIAQIFDVNGHFMKFLFQKLLLVYFSEIFSMLALTCVQISSRGSSSLSELKTSTMEAPNSVSDSGAGAIAAEEGGGASLKEVPD
jgi:hypothetical protein